jgi:subfamily B ATP-binding cassette protein MsbA
MKNLIILFKLSLTHKKDIGLNLIFNLLGMFFSLFSFAMVIPVLRIIFNTNSEQFIEMTNRHPNGIIFSEEGLMDWTNYQVANYVVQNGKFDTLVIICIFLVSMVFLKNLFTYLSMFFRANVINGIAKNLRTELFNKILHLQLAYFTEEKKGDLLSRFSSDIREIEVSMAASINAIFKDPFYILGYFITLFIISAKLSIFILIFLPVAGAVISIIGNSLKRKTNKGQEDSGKLLSMAEETLYGLRIIKGFNAEDRMNTWYNNKNKSLYKTMLSISKRVYLASPISEFLGVTTTAGVLIYGGNLVFQGEITPDFFIGYLILFSQLISPFKAISKAIYESSRGASALNRIDEILDAKTTITNNSNAIELESLKGNIEFVNVHFKYKDEFVLKNINLKIQKGQTIAVVGQSGSGKTTMADLVPRYYDVNEGEITINNINIKNYSLNSLRACIAMVTQESILFNDTIKNNLAFGIENASIENIIEAAKIANAHEFITKMEDGYNSNIGDGGSKLSGGQKQRLSIARAILKNPELLILDEATSALDTESEKLVQEALTRLMKNRTSLVIAHRLSTIQHSDIIIVLEKGEIVEQGSHVELIKKAGHYSKFIKLQNLS